MKVDEMLSSAAASIGRMPAQELAAGLEELEGEHQRRMNDDLAAHADHADAALRPGMTLDLLTDRSCRPKEPSAF